MMGKMIREPTGDPAAGADVCAYSYDYVHSIAFAPPSPDVVAQIAEELRRRGSGQSTSFVPSERLKRSSNV
ncbi:MAG: hypothetical protein ABI548_07030 [Polyangiaceae bacterium]